jgi:hypothetical protein
MLTAYTNSLYANDPIEVTFAEAMELIRDAFSFNGASYGTFGTTWQEEVLQETDLKKKFQIAIRDAIFQIARMSNAISIFYDGYDQGAVMSLNKNICSIHTEDIDLVYTTYIDPGELTREKTGNFVISRINMLLLFIMIDLYKKNEPHSGETLCQHVCTSINAYYTTLVTEKGEKATDAFKNYVDSINAFCISKAIEIGNQEVSAAAVGINNDFKNITLQQIYSMLILFQGNSFFNQYFGKVFAVEAACTYNNPVITRGMQKNDIPFIMKNSPKINSLFDLGPLDKCLDSAGIKSKPMIENYLSNSKTCIVKVNDKGQIVIETTFAYLVVFHEKIVAIVLSKDEANLSDNSYKQMDQIRNVLTSENRAVIITKTDNELLHKFLNDLQPLDKYNRQYANKSTLEPSHKYDGTYCVFLNERTGNSVKEIKCISTTNQTTDVRRAGTDVLKKSIRFTTGLGNDQPDPIERNPSPLKEEETPLDSDSDKTDSPDATVHSPSVLTIDYPVPTINDDTRFAGAATCHTPIPTK